MPFYPSSPKQLLTPSNWFTKKTKKKCNPNPLFII